jgi:hypothetical protein
MTRPKTSNTHVKRTEAGPNPYEILGRESGHEKTAAVKLLLHGLTQKEGATPWQLQQHPIPFRILRIGLPGFWPLSLPIPGTSA